MVRVKEHVLLRFDEEGGFSEEGAVSTAGSTTGRLLSAASEEKDKA